jgi:hypothetical protein
MSSSKRVIMKCVLNFLLMLSILATLSGCGDLFGKKVIKRGLETTQFRANCELDVNEFAYILKRNISSQIKCLEENLNIFFKYVETPRAGYLSRVALEQYIKKNRPDIKPEIVKALKSVFDINFLITGSDPDFISKRNVQDVVNFALTFNAEAALNFGPIFQSKAPVTYALHQNHRDRVSAANKAIIMALRKIFNPNRKGEIHKLNIIDLLESFTTEETREHINKARKLLFVKKVVLGGNKEEVTHLEVERLLLNFDQILLITLDAVRYKYIVLKQDSLLQLLKKDVSDFADIVFQSHLGNRENEYFFSIEEAFNTVKMFVSDETFDVDKFRKMILEAKRLLMGGNDQEVRGGEVLRLVNHGKTILQTGTVFHRIYDKFKIAMESPLPVTINFDEYRHTYPEHQKELNQFERIVKNYRFVKGEFVSAYYNHGFKRNADGIYEIALIEYALTILFQNYGSPSPNADSVGGYSMDQFEFRALVFKFEKELIEMGLILPQKAGSVADNISLLGTLFQYQSDNNKVLDVNEASEFAVSLFTSIKMATELHGHFKKIGCAMDEYDRIEPECFKQNFFQGFCQNYLSYYPLLMEYLGASKCDELENTEHNMSFLSRSIGAARSCNYYKDGNREEIFYSQGDIMTILLAMFHAETTILRWDANNNNILDVNEVNNAYSIYSGALDGFLAGKPSIIRRLKKQIYQYLIKYEEVPDETNHGSVWKFAKFLLRFNKQSTANRKTIVSVLMAIGEQNAKMSIDPKFDCNYLRDPTNIPTEP